MFNYNSSIQTTHSRPRCLLNKSFVHPIRQGMYQLRYLLMTKGMREEVLNICFFHLINCRNQDNIFNECFAYVTKNTFVYMSIFYISSVQSLSWVQPFITPRTAAHQAALSINNSRSLLKLMSTESVMPSNHLILCHPFLLPSIFPSIRVFSNESVLCIR